MFQSCAPVGFPHTPSYRRLTVSVVEAHQLADGLVPWFSVDNLHKSFVRLGDEFLALGENVRPSRVEDQTTRTSNDRGSTPPPSVCGNPKLRGGPRTTRVVMQGNTVTPYIMSNDLPDAKHLIVRRSRFCIVSLSRPVCNPRVLVEVRPTNTRGGGGGGGGGG